jgi:hypothetical protein
MWPYMLAGLACGSRIILYDGSPLFPDAKTYLLLIDEQKYAKFSTYILTQADMFFTALRISVRAPASYLKSRAVESFHDVSAHNHLSCPAEETFFRGCWRI